MLMQDDKTEAPIQEPSQEQQPGQDPDALSWTGSEYIYHEKSKGWFLNLLGVAILSAGGLFVITRDFILTGMVLFCAFLFSIFSRRQPKQIKYSISDTGFEIGNNFYTFNQYKSFVIAQDGAMKYITLNPVKRFDTLKTLYCAPEQLDQITEIVAAHLPIEDHEPDPIERLMHKVRF